VPLVLAALSQVLFEFCLGVTGGGGGRGGIEPIRDCSGSQDQQNADLHLASQPAG
jgi:hypothetical protein